MTDVQQTPRSNKRVSDASKLPETSDPAAILKQVEFYFSDENLPRDKFLFQTAEKNNGWVEIETIHKFARMRRFQPLSAVVAALKQSESLLEVSEDDKKVRRRIPLKEPKPEEKKEAFVRTVYAKGFGEETETSQFDIEAFFEQFGEVKQVRLRRSDDKSFKQSVFAEFATQEQADKFLEEKRSFNDNELTTMSKQAYVDMKQAEHGFTANANGKRNRFNAFKKRGGNRNDRPGPYKRRRDSEQKPKESKPEESKPEESKPEAEAKETAE